MRALVLNESKSPLVAVDDHPEPQAGDGFVLDMTACGVSHSERSCDLRGRIVLDISNSRTTT